MKIIRGLHNLPTFTQATAVTIGNFDGIHLGHQRIVETLLATAKQRHMPSVLILFEPQPLEFLQPEQAPSRITPFHEKVQLLREMGLDYLVCLYFNQKLVGMRAKEFINTILLERLKTGYLLVGDDFRFGYKREGNHELLAAAALEHHFELASFPTVMQDELRVSSTRVRQALRHHDFKHAALLLGRPYSLSGHVKPGDQRGRLLGFPTANILLKHDKLVLSGVFAVDVMLEDHQYYHGVANLGVRPTVDGLRRKLEVHLFDFAGDLYGQRLKVIFKYKIRDEQRFADIDALKQQIWQDVIAAKAFFELEKKHD
jgi:riboflavin kinase/FMN adenylyltransferase